MTEKDDSDAEPSREERFVPLDDAGNHLGGISRRTVQRMVDRGDLAMVMLGNRGYITLRSIKDYVDRIEHEAHREAARRAKSRRAKK